MEINEKLAIGDVVEMRKAHPCGGKIWEIVRVGADIGLVCQTCGRRILIPRRKFAARARRFVRRAAADSSLETATNNAADNVTRPVAPGASGGNSQT